MAADNARRYLVDVRAMLTLFIISAIVCCCNAVAIATEANKTAAVQDAELRKLAEDFWEWQLRECPEGATVYGVHEYDNLLESYDEEAISRRKQDCVEFSHRANAIPIDRLSTRDQLTWRVLTDQLNTFVEGHRYKDYGVNPISFLAGFHHQPLWVDTALFRSESDYNNYLQRLTALPTQVEQIKRLMEKAIRLGRTNHAVSMQGVVSDLVEMAECEVDASYFYRPYSTTLDALPLSSYVKANIRNAGINTIRTQVQPAFRTLANFVHDTYLPATRQAYGITSLPGGGAYYNALLRWYLSVYMTPREIHDIGLSEVQRIWTKMIAVAKRLGHTGEMGSFMHGLRTDSRYYNHTETQYLNLFESTVYKRILPRLTAVFSTRDLSAIPNITVQKTATDGIAAMYYRNTLLINTRRPHTRPSFAVLVLSLHEGLPGHHLQVSLAAQKNVPEFRRHVQGGRKYAVPYSFPYYTSYVEGWAMYAEYLGEELGLYDNDYELFGRYCYEILRACRLVVDTGIHAFGWSRDQAVEYMVNHTFLAQKQVEVEVDRYITWPGQACAYKIGELKVKQIREKASRILGTNLDIREFHSAMLDVGPVSLEILDAFMDNWIAQQASHFNITIETSTPSVAVTVRCVTVTCAFWATSSAIILYEWISANYLPS